MNEAATPVTLGALNRKMLLDYIRKNGPTSRADLHRNLNMSAPTVSANVKKLLDEGFLLEAGEANNTIGRKATLLVFNEKRAYVAGVDIGRSEIRVTIADLRGTEIISLKEAALLPELSSQLDRLISTAMEAGHIERSKLKCITLGIPGIRDVRTGKAILVPFVEKIDLNDLVGMLKSEYSAKVLVENSVNCGAIGEKWQGVSKGYRNTLYISYGIGIGAGIILNGELFSGAFGAAGEIGYMVPDSVRMLSEFDVCGALEQAISGGVIMKMLQESGREGEIAAIFQEKQTDDFSRDLTENVVRTMGQVMINLTAAFNVEAIVLGGGLGDLLVDHFRPVWLDMLRRHVPFVPEILSSKLHAKANVLGAVALAMRYINENCFDITNDA